MPTRCIVAGCSNTTKEGVSLHRFPKDEKIRKIWTSRVKLTRGKWLGPTDSSVICGDHFNESDFEEEGLWSEFGMKRLKKLKPNAIPKIKSTLEKSSTEEKGRKKSRPGSEKRKKRKMLDEMLEEHEKQISQTSSTTEEETEQEETSMELTDSPASQDIDQPGPSWMCISTERDQPGPSWKSVGIPSAPAMDMALETPRRTRSFGTQTRTVATRLKHVQATVRVHEKGVLTQLQPECTSRGTMTSKLEKEKEEEESPSSSSSSHSPPEAPQSPEYTPSSDSSDDDYRSPHKSKKKKTGTKAKAPFQQRDIPSHEDTKYIVFESQLLELMNTCEICGSGDVELTKRVTGTHLKVDRECNTCRAQFSWQSQPWYGRYPAGNILLSAAILFAGAGPAQALRLMKFLHLAVIEDSTFFSHQRKFLQPSIEKVWESQQLELVNELKERGTPITVGGDGRADSPGFSAKYGTYSAIELHSKKIIDLQLVQSNEVKNSSHMELEGFKRVNQKLTDLGLVIGKLITDRHRQLAKYVRETTPGIDHQFDVWHIAKGIRKKIHALSKKKGCEVVGQWEQSICNHIYWTASSTPVDQPELRIAKWRSLSNHIQGVHEGHSELFPKCLHGSLDGERKKKWLKPGTYVCEKLEDIVNSGTLLKDVKKMSDDKQTSALESFHNVINQFAPKMKAYKYHGILSRVHLAAIHFNWNADRPQATTKSGKKAYKVRKLKYKLGRASVTEVKGPRDFGYVAELVKEVVKRTNENKRSPRKRAAPPPLTSGFDYPSKEELVQQHRSRFNDNKD